MTIVAIILVVFVIRLLVDIAFGFLRRYRWRQGKGPNDHEVATALDCLSCYMKTMQRGLKMTTIKSITIDAQGDYDVTTLPTLLVRQEPLVDTKPNRR